MGTEMDKFHANMFELKQNNLYCDVVLVAKADSTRIPVHRVVLHAASEYFQKLLTTSMKEMNADEIVLGGVAGAVLEQLLEFCYTRKITIEASNAIDVLAAADLFRFVEVVEMCEKVCVDAVDATNALGLLAIADRFGLNALQEVARTFAHQHFLDIIKNDEYLRLDAGRVIDLLESDDIEVHSEEEVYNAIVKWIDVDRDARKQQYVSLMKSLRVSKIEMPFLLGSILNFSKELNMAQVFMNACEVKQQQVAADAERRWITSNCLIAVGLSSVNENGQTQVNRYSIAANAWETLQTFFGTYDSHLHYIDNCLYFIRENAVESMSLRTMQLEAKQAPRLGGKYFTSVADGQYVYMISGMKVSSLKSVERYDTKKDEWVEIAMLNHPRINASAAVLDGKVYVVGGIFDVFERYESPSVECYDPRKNRWTEIAPLNVARKDHRCCTIRGSIYALGGFCGYQALASIEKYDAQFDQWTIIHFQLDVPRANFGIAVSGDWVYVVYGDFSDMSMGRKINVFDGRIEKVAGIKQTVKHCVLIP